MITRKNQKGTTIIAAIFIIVVLAFMGVMFLTMVNTGNFTAVNDMQSAQALNVAEGGMEYILANRTFPNYSMAGALVTLGTGNFTVSTPTYLTADPGAPGTTINVQSTATFPNAGRIVIDSELITYTGKNAAQFNAGVARGVGGTIASAHAIGNAVYPVTTVAVDNPLPIGNTTINVTSNVGFSVPGVIIIDTEYIFCAGVNGTTQFTNCARGYKGSSAAAHLLGSNVFQYAITSTGFVGSAQRAVTCSSMQIRNSGAMMVYAKLNGDPIPYYRRWDGTAWGVEFQANSVGAGRTIQYMMLKFARTRNEAILGTLDSTGDIRVQVWNGVGWGATTLVGNASAANSVYRGFDIEYETSGDRAIVVYNNNVANQVSYRIWNGLVWTAPANQNLASVSIGNVRWIELARNPLSASNEIAMIVLGSTNVYVYGLRWTGAAWNNMGAAAAWDTAGSTSAYKSAHVAYEQQTGRAVYIWGRSTNRSLNYRIWNGAILNLGAVTTQDIASIGIHTARWVRLAPDPYSNEIMLGVQDSGSDMNTSLWNGAAWDAAGTEHDKSLEDASRNFDLVYETAAVNAGRAWVLWGNGSKLSRRQWNGAAWGAITTTGDDTSFIQLVAHPVSGAVLSGIYESSASATRDIWESHLTSGGAVWSAKFTAWGGPTIAAPVMERLCLAVERRNDPPMLLDWKEMFP